MAYSPASKGQIQQAIYQASSRTGVDFKYLLANAKRESGLNAQAKAPTSSATGLFQFIERTWLEMVQRHGDKYGLDKEAAQISRTSSGKPYVADPAMRQHILNLRKDPKISSFMAAELADDNKQYLQRKVGGQIGKTDLYLAHFLGAKGAADFIKAHRSSPNRAAAVDFSKAAAANRHVFYTRSGQARSYDQIYQKMSRSFADEPAASSPAQVPRPGVKPSPKAEPSTMIAHNHNQINKAPSRPFLYGHRLQALSQENLFTVLMTNSDYKTV